MAKRKRSGNGFSAPDGQEMPNNHASKGSLGHVSKELEAATLFSRGKLKEAEEVYRALIAHGTKSSIVYGNLAVLCGIKGRLNELIMLLKKAIQLNYDFPDAHNNLGVAYRKKGNIDLAIASYKTALQLKPNYPEAYNNLANAMKDKGDLSAAVCFYKKALRLRYDYPEAHNSLGIALQHKGNLNDAISSYKTALLLRPDYVNAHCNLGVALQASGDLDAAVASYKTALYHNPDDHAALGNMGVALHEQGDLDAAIATYATLLRLNPNAADTRWHSSLSMLLSGDYTNGWGQYEWRTKTEIEALKLHALPKCTQNRSKASHSKTNQLLLVTEQGLGDTLQFMRYIIELQRHGVLVSLCAQPKLHTLIKESGIDADPMTPAQANEIRKGFWMPLMSLPRYLEVSPSNPIITEPYIKSTEALMAKWRSILSEEQRPIVGINWQGNPETEKTLLRGRSLSLKAFEPIVRSGRISLLSLQKGVGSEQLRVSSLRDHFVRCQEEIDQTWDFLETAAIIANCDLIISSDTCVAHLAGGMGKPIWLLLQKIPDWRWGLVGDTTFWYSSMRIFRQKERGDWQEVMERVAQELPRHFS